MSKVNKEAIERVVIKLPKSVAEYLRKEFKHGQRSDFIAKCILDYKHNREVREIEEKLRQAAKNRQ